MKGQKNGEVLEIIVHLDINLHIVVLVSLYWSLVQYNIVASLLDPLKREAWALEN
jgi:hypothetical protein